MVKRFKIVENSTHKGSFFLTDTKKEYENIGVDNPDDVVVQHLLHIVNSFDELDYNVVAVHDYIVGLERCLILVEKLQKDFDSIARRNFNEDDNDARKRREYQFLMIGDNVIDEYIDRMWDYLEWLRSEFGFKHSIVNDYGGCDFGEDCGDNR